MALFIGIFVTLAVINALLLLFSTFQRSWKMPRRAPKQTSITKTEVYTQG